MSFSVLPPHPLSLSEIHPRDDLRVGPRASHRTAICRDTELRWEGWSIHTHVHNSSQILNLNFVFQTTTIHVRWQNIFNSLLVWLGTFRYLDYGMWVSIYFFTFGPENVRRRLAGTFHLPTSTTPGYASLLSGERPNEVSMKTPNVQGWQRRLSNLITGWSLLSCWFKVRGVLYNFSHWASACTWLSCVWRFPLAWVCWELAEKGKVFL